MMQRRGIDRGIDVACGQQCGQRRSEAKTARPFRVIERLDAEPVARQNDAAGVALPYREREHAVKAFDAARSPFRIGFEDDFSVALREKAIALGRKLGAQFAKIVDAAVEDDGEAEFRIDHRLLRCGGKIDDAEPAMTERHAILRECAAGVRPARPHLLRHRRERTARNVAIKRHLTANAAHFIMSRTEARPTGPQQRFGGEPSS